METSDRKKDAEDLDLPQDFENVLKRLAGDESDGEGFHLAAGIEATDVLPISAEIAKQRAEASRQADNPQTPEVGQWIRDKGIYIGTWEPTDEKGKSLDKIFDLYAAPEDLKKDTVNRLSMTFNDAACYVSRLKDWFNYDGSNLKSDKDVMEAVKNNPKELSKWFIPTIELLIGQDANGNKVQNTNLYDKKEKMPHGSEFSTKTVDDLSDVLNVSTWYWSCTEQEKNASFVYNVSFSGGKQTHSRRDNFHMFTRPVRAELRP